MDPDGEGHCGGGHRGQARQQPLPVPGRPKTELQGGGSHQQPLRQLAQGQEGPDCGQDGAQDPRLHRRRHHLQRDEGRLRGQRRQEELGDCYG